MLTTNGPRFAKEEDLKGLLGVAQGSVSPLCVMNDKETKVTLVLDGRLRFHYQVV